MLRLLRYCLLLGVLLCTSSATFAGSWEPVEGPYSKEAATSIYNWIEENIHSATLPQSTADKDTRILKNLVKGTLVWAYSYGSCFNVTDFLKHFSNKDSSLRMLRLEDGGILFTLESGFYKICMDTSSPEARIFPENQKYMHPRNRWLATIFNESSDITFYFSAMGPSLSQSALSNHMAISFHTSGE